MSNTIYIIGAGPGTPGRLTPAARDLLDRCPSIAGGAALLPLAPAGAHTHAIGHPLEETRDFIAGALESGNVGVLASGDPGCFSILPFIQKNFPGHEIIVEPGISSVQLLAARLGLGWESWRLVSLHGRGAAVKAPVPHEPTVFFCDDVNPPQDVARLLLEEIADTWAAVGTHLGRPEESVWQGTLLEAAAGHFSGGSLLLVSAPVSGGKQGGRIYGARRPMPAASLAAGGTGGATAPGIPDELWSRAEGIPLSRSEFRAVLLSKVQPAGRGVIWDVGSGTGSYAVECSLLAPVARVIAIDRRPEACSLVLENAARFGATVEAVCGEAPGILAGLPAPDLAIIGGNNGRLIDIFNECLHRLSPGGRLAVTAVLDETRRSAHELFADSELQNRQSVKVEIARGEGHEWHDLNPVILFCGDKPDE